MAGAHVKACVECGCTDDHACPGGCAWYSDDPPLCTSCTGEVDINLGVGVDVPVSAPLLLLYDAYGVPVPGPPVPRSRRRA